MILLHNSLQPYCTQTGQNLSFGRSEYKRVKHLMQYTKISNVIFRYFFFCKKTTYIKGKKANGDLDF